MGLRPNAESDSTLNDRLAAIGFRIATSVTPRRAQKAPVDIEETLLEAIQASEGDGRLASLICSWLVVHGAYVNVERLAKLTKFYPEKPPPAIRLLSVYAAFAFEHCGHKWKKLIRKSKEPITLYPAEITESAVQLKGAVDYLKKFGFIVPNGSLRIREDDVLKPEELIQRNRLYRNRYLYGPSWRADIITALEAGAKSPAEIVKQVGCSYEPAHRIFREYQLVQKSA